MQSDMSRRVSAELFGTFWLTFGGCGAAVLAAAFPAVGIGLLGVSFAFGLTVLTMAYAVGHISGGHFNPAVTLGLWSAGRCANKHVLPYIVAQVSVRSSPRPCCGSSPRASPTGCRAGSPRTVTAISARASTPARLRAVTEFVMTFFFLYIIVGTTSQGAATASPASRSAWR